MKTYTVTYQAWLMYSPDGEWSDRHYAEELTATYTVEARAHAVSGFDVYVNGKLAGEDFDTEEHAEENFEDIVREVVAVEHGFDYIKDLEVAA